MSKQKTVVIIGGGPGGSTLALRLSRMGLSVVIVEKSTFPREHIGESLTGECGILLRDFGFEDQLNELDFPIKRGVAVHGARSDAVFWVPVAKTGADGSLIQGETWQVRRPEFDAMLLDAAQSAGTQVIHATAIGVEKSDDDVPNGLIVRDGDGTNRTIGADFIVDASGLSTFLSKVGIAGGRTRGNYQKQIAFYAQFKGARRDAAPNDGNTHIFYSHKHHWAWFIPISNDVTSVGVVVPSETFKDSGQNPAAFLGDSLKTLNVHLADRMEHTQRVSEVWSTSNYSHRVSNFVGPRHLCLGDAHRFTDPIFSFGVSNSIKEAQIAAQAIADALALDIPRAAVRMKAYEALATGAQDRVETLIDTFWNYPLAFLKLARFDRPNDISELFSGRIYDPKAADLPAMQMMQKLLGRASQPVSA